MPFKSKTLAEKGLDKLCRDASARFMTKKNLRMSMFVGTLPKGLLQSHLRIRNVGCEDKKEETKTRCCSESIPTQTAFKATFKQTIENSSFAVMQEIPSCHRQENEKTNNRGLARPGR